MRSHNQQGLCALFAAALLSSLAGCGADATPAGASDAAVALNGCTEAMFVDRTAAGAERVIGFGGARTSGPFTYAPRCLTVAAGQTVVFEGSFNAHPLSPGTAPGALTAGSPNNPIPRMATTSALMVMFPAAGNYPYFCEVHYAAGMNGVVRVR